MPSAEPTQSHRVRWFVAVVLVVAIGGIIFTQTRGGQKQDIAGEFTLMDGAIRSDNNPDTCVGDGGYDDIRGGIAVTVRDGSGTVIATGELGSGETELLLIDWCTFPIVVKDVPTAEFYSIEVGRRGELTYSHEEMEDQDWSVFFTLGG